MKLATRRSAPLGSKWFSGQASLKMKDFRLDGHLDPSGGGGEPKNTAFGWLLVHFLTSVFMIARGLREAATEEDGEGPERQ
jgi:hypothetical protein